MRKRVHVCVQEVQACTVDMELSSGDSEPPDNSSKTSSILAREWLPAAV